MGSNLRWDNDLIMGSNLRWGSLLVVGSNPDFDYSEVKKLIPQKVHFHFIYLFGVFCWITLLVGYYADKLYHVDSFVGFEVLGWIPILVGFCTDKLF